MQVLKWASEYGLSSETRGRLWLWGDAEVGKKPGPPGLSVVGGPRHRQRSAGGAGADEGREVRGKLHRRLQCDCTMGSIRSGSTGRRGHTSWWVMDSDSTCASDERRLGSIATVPMVSSEHDQIVAEHDLPEIGGYGRRSRGLGARCVAHAGLPADRGLSPRRPGSPLKKG